MATLAQVIAGDQRFTGTPLASFALQQYLKNDKLWNKLEFVPIATKDNQGVFKYTYNIFKSNAASVNFRILGSEPTASNNIPTQATTKLAILSGAIQVDIEQARGDVSGSLNGMNNYVQEQMALKVDDVVNSFAINFIQGNSSTNAAAFDGLEVLCPAARTNSTAINIGTGSYEEANVARMHVGNIIGAVTNPNCIITSYEGMNYLTSIEAKNGIVAMPQTANGLTFATYNGLPIIPLTRDCFSASELAIGEPFYVARMDERRGLQTVIPNDGQILIVIDPRQYNNGSVVKNGIVETNIGIAVNDLFAIAKGYITCTVAPLPSFMDNSNYSVPVEDDDEDDTP